MAEGQYNSSLLMVALVTRLSQLATTPGEFSAPRAPPWYVDTRGLRSGKASVGRSCKSTSAPGSPVPGEGLESLSRFSDATIKRLKPDNT
ncbi:hypothetical protein H671_1g4067 [Cricetulus griseus]|nr:hypothetical protein H671_1g4067 [Cricetulus griseus]